MFRNILKYVFIGTVLLAGCKGADAPSANEILLDGTADVGVLHRRKREIIEAKTASFPYVAHTVLEGIENAASYEVHMFRNDYTLDDKTLIEVEAILPDAQSHFYEAWLHDEGGPYVSLGALTYQGPELYELRMESDTDIATMSGVLISRDTVADGMPDTIIARGAFGDE